MDTMVKMISVGRYRWVYEGNDFAYYVPLFGRLQYGFLKIRRGDIVLDIGAYPGDFSIYASEEVGDSGLVIAVEPHPNNFRILKENIRLNGLRNIIPLNFALNNKEGKVTIMGEGVDAKIGVRGYLIDAVTFDSILGLTGVNHIDVLKMDCEVCEGIVLSENNILDFRELAIETHSIHNFEIVTRLLKQEGYRIKLLSNSMIIQNAFKCIIKRPLEFVQAEIKSSWLGTRMIYKSLLKKEPLAPATGGNKSVKVVFATKNIA